MDTRPSPSDIARRPPSEIGLVTEGHDEQIRRFAFFPFRGERGEQTSIEPSELGRRAWEDVLASLAALAEPEEWSGTQATSRPFPILDSFIRYTHVRLVLEDKIGVTDDGGHAASNTGLLTVYGEEIFGLFQKNSPSNQQRWRFVSWVTESDRDFLRAFREPPQMAEYVTESSELVYDWRRELKLSYEHILGDNIDRFPPELAAQPLRAKQALESAVGLTLRRVRRNHKLVIPQWYPRLRDSGAQFLMPLDLTGDGKADLALVVAAIGDRAYRGNTVLTLGMAYTNARLVARPDSDWLIPTASSIPALDEPYEDEDLSI